MELADGAATGNGSAMRCLLQLAALGLLGFLQSAAAAAVKDRAGSVRGDRDRMVGDARWIYHDATRGFAEAKATF